MMTLVLKRFAGVEHTLDKGLAVKRLIESASTPIYIVDGCHAGKHTTLRKRLLSLDGFDAHAQYKVKRKPGW